MDEQISTETTEQGTIADESISDATLDSAVEGIEGTTEQEAEQQQQAEVIEEEQDISIPDPEIEAQRKKELDDRSQLGRKFAAYKKDNDLRFTEISESLKNITSALQSNALKTPEETELDYDPDEPVTSEMLDRKLESAFNKRDQRLESKKMEEEVVKTKYSTDYISTIEIISNEEKDETFRKEVLAELQTNFNNWHSYDGKFDADKNWSRAERAVLRKKLAKPLEKNNPVKGAKSANPMIKGLDTTNSSKKAAMPTYLGSLTDSLIKHSGFTEEDVANLK